MAKKPPLEVVRTVRQRALDEAANALRGATHARREAEELAARTAREESAARAETAARKQSEEAALADAASPRELAQLAAFELAEQRRVQLVAERAAAAAELQRKAEAKEETRRGEVVTSRAGLDVVEKVQETWRDEQREAEEARIDEQAADVHAARRR